MVRMAINTSSPLCLSSLGSDSSGRSLAVNIVTAMIFLANKNSFSSVNARGGESKGDVEGRRDYIPRPCLARSR